MKLNDTRDSAHVNRITPFILLLVLYAEVTASGLRFDQEWDIVYKEIDGKKLKLNTYVPKGEGPFPAILVLSLIHI